MNAELLVQLTPTMQAVIANLGATAQTAAQSEKLLQPKAPSAKRKVLYPIREPHPVELTAPIVFLDAPTF